MNVTDRKQLEPRLSEALRAAESSLPQSHCPHSGLCVSAALVLGDGSALTGINYESDSYGLTLCAERTAIARAQVTGKIDSVEGLVLSAKWRDSSLSGTPLTPCGACRQWLAELARRLDRDIPVYSFWEGQSEGVQTSALELLPGAFSIKNT